MKSEALRRVGTIPALRFLRLRSRAGNERIVLLLVGDGRCRSVAGQDDGVVGKRIELGSNRIGELVEAAVRKVRAPDAPLEQDVAAKDHKG